MTCRCCFDLILAYLDPNLICLSVSFVGCSDFSSFAGMDDELFSMGFRGTEGVMNMIKCVPFRIRLYLTCSFVALFSLESNV